MTLYNKQQYFIAFNGDYSHYSYLYLICKKSQSLNMFKIFKVEIEYQLGKKIKTVKSGLSSEYCDRYDRLSEQYSGSFVRI